MKGPFLPEVETKVRWRQGTNYGLIFDSLLEFADLAWIAAGLQGISAPRPSRARSQLPRQAGRNIIASPFMQ